ncbi:SpoIIE family protein phosphatase [Lentisphaerota bacterium WC36G]|nr:SpoIIE family protein phosphatase [Lentisphaerae bacterium WC36]
MINRFANNHLEIEFSSKIKTGEDVCGDDFKSKFIAAEGRYISVLSDGLGSGIKASLLSNMVTTMALKFVEDNVDFLASAEIMMDSLPICEVRKISYATFTIVDAMIDGTTKIIEMDNPHFIHLRGTAEVEHDMKTLVSDRWNDRKIYVSEFKMKHGDRLIFFSDGVSQAGLGQRGHKFGWKREGCLDYIKYLVSQDEDISARKLSQQITTKACTFNPNNRKIDDISCGVAYYREPRRTILLTGPPYKESSDSEFADIIRYFKGKKIICGGTTASIISRELKREILTDIKNKNGFLPMTSEMKGVNLVTEGILTLTELAKYLESGETKETAPSIKELVELFHESDIVDFVVGTRVNIAHQDPTLPVDLEIRRNIVKKIKVILEINYRKIVNVRYI